MSRKASQADSLQLESTARTPSSATLPKQKAKVAKLHRRRAPLVRLAKRDLLYKEEVDLNKLNEAKRTVGLILTPLRASFFQTQGDLSVAAGFLLLFETAEEARSNTDREVTADPSNPF